MTITLLLFSLYRCCNYANYPGLGLIKAFSSIRWWATSCEFNDLINWNDNFEKNDKICRTEFRQRETRKFKSRNQWEDINTVFVLPTKPQWIKAGELIFSSSLRPPQCRHLFLNWWDVGCTPTIKSITPAIYLTHNWSEIADLNHFQVSVKGEICTSARRRPETRPYYIIKKLIFFCGILLSDQLRVSLLWYISDSTQLDGFFSRDSSQNQCV